MARRIERRSIRRPSSDCNSNGNGNGNGNGSGNIEHAQVGRFVEWHGTGHSRIGGH
jgi:hypothetical protein